MNRIAASLAGVVLAAMLLACGGQPNLGNPGGKGGDGNQGGLSVTSHQFAAGQFGTTTITGTVRNSTNKNYGYAQVQINLYDANGAQVGSTLATTNNLEPNGTWSFEAIVISDRATRYKIMDVSGF